VEVPGQFTEALEGPDEAKYVFCANLVMAIMLVVVVFGFHGFVTVMLTAVAMMFVIIFDITRDDGPSLDAPNRHRTE
jgi:hypothetical protein